MYLNTIEPKQRNKESQSLFLYGLLCVCFTSHAPHGVAMCGVAGNNIKPQKQTAKNRLQAVLQHPLPRSDGEVAYTRRRWNTNKIIFLARKGLTIPIFVFISSSHFYNVIT